MNEIEDLVNKFGKCEVIPSLSHNLPEIAKLAGCKPCAVTGDIGKLMYMHRFISASDVAIQTWHYHYASQDIPHVLIKRRSGNGRVVFELWKQRRCYPVLLDNNWELREV